MKLGSLYCVFIVAMFIYSLFILYKYIKFFKVSKMKMNDTLNDDKGLFIAIPCLREQKIIEDTIKHFRKICNLPIVIITTFKENFEAGNSKNYITTRNIVESNILNKYSDIYLIEYPLTNGYMADQLNFMLKHLTELNFYDEKKDWYMALYNADSKPIRTTFKSVFYQINRDKKVIQQYSYCFKNFNSLDFITKGFAIYQSNFEIKVGLFNSSLNYKYLYNYVVGHGLTINLKILESMGNFNTKFWCEDIYLTMKLKFNNIKITPIIELENIENAVSINQIVKQNAVWYDTTRKYKLIYEDISKEENRISFYGLIGFFNEFRCAINWLFFPLIFIINIIVCVYIENIIFFIILILILLFYSFINYFITIKTINKLGERNYLFNIHNYTSYVVALLISNIGPIYSIIFKKNNKYKTER